MIRRRPARDRFGVASFGRRVPRVNSAAIRAEVESIQKISVLDLEDFSDAQEDVLNKRDISKHPIPLHPERTVVDSPVSQMSKKSFALWRRDH